MNNFKPYPTSAKQRTVDGFAFQCVSVGVSNCRWYCTAADASIGSYLYRTTYYASVHGERIGDRYRTQESALKAIAKELRKRGIKP